MTQVVFGAGPVGRAIAAQLAGSTPEVILVSRSGKGPTLEGVTRVAVDASDLDAVQQVSRGATVIYNALNPAYHRWVSDWPPMAAALLTAATAEDTVLVTVSNLYGYGPVTGSMTADLPLAAPGVKGRVRAEMFEQARSAYEAGQAKTVEVRASDYIGPDAESHMGDRVVPRVLAGKSVKVIGAVDQPHSWTYPEDVATLAVACGSDPAAWGRAWHVPSNAARTQRQVVADFAPAAGVPTPKVSACPRWLLRAMGAFSPMIRELRETTYQFEEPFVLDSSASQEHFGLAPTSWSTIIDATVASYRDSVSADDHLALRPQ